MNFGPQRRVAAALRGATEDIEWGADLAYAVGAKMSRLFLLDDRCRAKSCSFKVDDARFLEPTGVPGVIPAPYLARAKRVQVRPGHALGTPAPSALIERSHALVMARLTKKLQREPMP